MYYLCVMINRSVAQYIEKEKLFTQKDKILVALSGGADSVALLRLLLSLGYSCEAAHCNFHLRDKESDRDEQFVRELCRQLGVSLHVTHFETARYAEEKHISIEMAARELRYQWFAELKDKQQAVVIAVAHHRDDSVETLLLNLIRGTGINGLLGIRPKNGDIVRPLLCVSREEIISYLNNLRQEYVTDSTNLQDEYTRNKIRLNLLPLMAEINPSVKESIIATSNHLSEAAAIYNKGINDGRQRVLTLEGIHIDRLLAEPAPKALLFEILHPLGFNSAQTEDINACLTGQPGKQFKSKEWRVIKDREILLISKELEEENATPPFKLNIEEREYTADFVIPRDTDKACFDADKLKSGLTIRKWQQGDVFVPFGMKGRKRVSDYLTDRKKSLTEKEQQWVLCCGKEIAWLIGERTDNRFRIDETTRKVIIIIKEESLPGYNSV